MASQTKSKLRPKDKLRVTWSKREDDLMFHYPLGVQTKCDGGYMSGVFASLASELEKRGYDTTTIRFSIEPMAGNRRFASQRPKEKS